MSQVTRKINEQNDLITLAANKQFIETLSECKSTLFAALLAGLNKINDYEVTEEQQTAIDNTKTKIDEYPTWDKVYRAMLQEAKESDDLETLMTLVDKVPELKEAHDKGKDDLVVQLATLQNGALLAAIETINVTLMPKARGNSSTVKVSMASKVYRVSVDKGKETQRFAFVAYGSEYDKDHTSEYRVFAQVGKGKKLVELSIPENTVITSNTKMRNMLSVALDHVEKKDMEKAIEKWSNLGYVNHDKMGLGVRVGDESWTIFAKMDKDTASWLTANKID